MFVYIRGAASNSSWRQAAGDPHHLHRILHALLPERVGVHDFVGQRQLVVDGVEMADGGVDVDRLDRIAAGEMDAVEILRELHEVAKALAVAGAPAAVEVHGVRRARTLTKIMASPPTVTLRSGLRGVMVEARRRLLHLLHDEGAVHAHALRVHVDVAAGVLQDAAAPRCSGRGCRSPRGCASRRCGCARPLLVERLDRPVAVLRDRPWHLMDGGGAGAAAIAGAPAGTAPAPLLWFSERRRA